MLFSSVEIQETVDMFLRHKLDVRWIVLLLPGKNAGRESVQKL